MSGNISWDDLRLVLSIVQGGSMVNAATGLGLNHSTIFRRLNAIEKNFGQKLFERSRSGYEPTAAGRDIAALAMRMAQDINDLERTLAGRDVNPSGELRVTTNDTFAVHFLGPVLASFRRAYPSISLDIIVSHEALNLSRRDADIAVRAATEPPETLIGRKICAMPWARYAPAAWSGRIETAMAGGDENARRAIEWLGFGHRLSGIRANRWIESEIRSLNIAGRFDNLLALANAISLEVGAGILPCFIGDRTPGLVRFGEMLDFDYSLWLLTHSDLRNSARVRAFMDHAGQELAKIRPLIEGRQQN
ncbi:MAG: LysR family transcriptional regulator [Alphaproteobacteria bacterium]|nr:LysR family transcriptional regulator [Alphaproteobacteria bacterium]